MTATTGEVPGTGSRAESTLGRVGWVWLVAAALVATAVGPAMAQDGSADADTETEDATVTQDSASAADEPTEYLREVFGYPGAGRRNPFEPVDAGVAEGPQFQNLHLTGIIYSPSVGSVAVLLDRSTGERYRVRNGQTLGQARVLDIRRTEVRFAVSGAGETRRETLQVEERERESEG